ncbi:MAG: hypothetical protein BRD29_05220 [Bacteroidetes bacterium QH_2_67_10]|nr:MAG: hypothetical protein BRD29_05220 [Bacteroidetes bacterium QH_2_67_10]
MSTLDAAHLHLDVIAVALLLGSDGKIAAGRRLVEHGNLVQANLQHALVDLDVGETCVAPVAGVRFALRLFAAGLLAAQYFHLLMCLEK